MVIAVAAGVRLVRAANVSALTGPGTNTWLVGAPGGSGPVAVIDPGPDDPAHLEAILAAAGEVSHILVTHPHLDHSALTPRLQARTGAPVLAFGGATDGRSALMRRLADQGVAGGEGLDLRFRPDRRLADGEEIHGSGWSLTALHTPGHSAPHLAFLGAGLLFSGDLVMGWSSTLVSPPDGDMADCMRSLGRLLALGDLRLAPGHGDPVEDGAARIGWLLAHRRARRAEILAALEHGPRDIPGLTREIYRTAPAALLAAAERNVLAHLLELVEEGRVLVAGDALLTSTFLPA